MGGLSVWHIVIVAIIALLLFGGRGKVSDLMGDFAKGIKSFREGMNDPDETERPRSIAEGRQDEIMIQRQEKLVSRDQLAGN